MAFVRREGTRGPAGAPRRLAVLLGHLAMAGAALGPADSLADFRQACSSVSDSGRCLSPAPYLAEITAATVPPGQCYFGGDAWSSAPLIKRELVAHDTILLTFGLPEDTALGLSTCACLLVKGVDSEGKDVVRPYTPVSTNAMRGAFELMVKVYHQEGGALSTYLDKVELGEEVHFKHIPFNVKIQYPFGAKHVAMVVGGTGITPMLQALHALLGTADDQTKITLIDSNKSQKDILALETLTSWEAASNGRLTVVHTLTREPAESGWKGARGRIDRQMLEQLLPPPGTGPDHTLVFVCGPPAMYESLSGPRQGDYGGVLKEMGYSEEQVVRF